jgi:3-hydroxyisobutyrate dehydrogenase
VTDSVTVLGTGIMGAGMARSLLAAGFKVTVWNRSLDKAEPLAEAGATVADAVTSAVSGADVIVTMLFDGEAPAEVMERALPAAPTTVSWLQCATVGLESTARLADLAERHGADFVDAPVLGTRRPAETGSLIVLGGAPGPRRAGVAPVLDAIGSRTVWVGERPGDGQRLKLVLNSWLLSLVGGTAQAIALTSGLGLDPQLFLDTISGGALDCVYAQFKAKKMIAEDFSPDFTLAGATKDSSLIADALRRASIDDQLMEALHREFRVASDAGYDEEDMAAVVRAFLP